MKLKLETVKLMTLTIETPALLFSATSLILLAYTNRFLTIAQIVRGLKKTYDEKENKSILIEIANLNLRLSLIRYMQLAGEMYASENVFQDTTYVFKGYIEKYNETFLKYTPEERKLVMAENLK